MATFANNGGLQTGASHNGNILIVDDEKLVRFTLTSFLKGSGFRVASAESPNDALKEFSKDSFDAIISDIMMYPIDGFMFRDMIRGYNSEIPIIFLTKVDVDNSLLSKIMFDSYSYYVPKGSDRIFLTGKLKQVIANYKSHQKVKQLEEEMAKNQELASIVQFSMLPPWVRFEKNYEFSCFYKPFGVISGDLFDWIQLNDNCSLGVFGDISGHGTHSALGMTAVQSFLTQLTMYSEEKARQPHLVAQELNDFIIRHLHNTVYMCGLVVYCDFNKNIICLHNAGYPDVIGYDAVNKTFLDVNPDKKGSIPMGMYPDTKYLASENVTYHFSDDTLFLISSDGFWDLSKDSAGDNPLSLNPSDFKELLEILAQQSIEEDNTISMPYRCYEALEQLGYTYPQDDCLMFILRKPAQQDREKIFVCRLSPNNVAVDNVAVQASEFIMQQCNDMELAEKIELLVEEHMNNIVKHGLDSFRKENEYIVLKIAFAPNHLKVTIWDRGSKWMDDKASLLQDPDTQLELANDMQFDSGRGLSIIRKIASTISRQRHSGLNETVFFVPISSKGSDGEQSNTVTETL